VSSTRGRNIAGDRRGLLACVAIFTVTVAQLVALTVGELPQAEGKGFGYRLVFFPLLMILAPTLWTLGRRWRGGAGPLPWTAFAFIMAPFLVDVTGNTLDLYASIEWWDDANHFGNWVLLCMGLGLLMLHARMTPHWAVAVTVTGAGAVLAILWELGEWYTFIRDSIDLGTYEDTLGDELLGTLGGATAAVIVTLLARRRERPGS